MYNIVMLLLFYYFVSLVQYNHFKLALTLFKWK
jgi:hypothetical protein